MISDSYRVFARDPRFAVRVSLLLAAAMALPLLAFHFLYDFHLRPLPLPDSRRLVSVDRLGRDVAANAGAYSLPEAAELGRTLRGLDLAAYRVTSATLAAPEGAAREAMAEVAPEFFSVVTAQPAVGRLLRSEDRSSDRVAVISYRYWQSRFGGRPDVAGQTLTVSERSFTIAGVVDRDFAFFPLVTGVEPVVYVPVDSSVYPWPEQRWWRVVGRLHAGVSLESLRREQGPVLNSLADEVSRPYAGTLWQMMLLSLLVLLCATASAGALLLGRSVQKRTERAVRTALGATPGTLARSVFLENLALCLAGGLTGLALTLGAARYLRPFVEAYLELPRREPALLDLPIAGAVLGIAMLTAAVASLPALLESVQTEYSLARRTVRRHGTDPVLALDLLTVAQIGFAVVLLTAAVAAFQAAGRAESMPLGFDPQGLHSLRVILPAKYPLASARGIIDGFLSYARTIPGVESAAGSWMLPVHNEFRRDVQTAGPEAGIKKVRARMQYVTPGYFSLVKAEGSTGTVIDDWTTCDSASVVVNETLARALWSNTNAAGQRITLEGEAGAASVRGVVRNAHISAFLDAPPTVYQCRTVNFSYLVLRAPKGGGAAIQDLAAFVRRFDREIVVDQFAAFDDLLASSLAVPRLQRLVTCGLAVIALLLTVASLHGLVTAAVEARQRELALRMALGAQPAAVLVLLLRRVMLLLAAGGLCGFVAALAGERYERTLRYAADAGGTEPLAIAVCGVLALGVAACLNSGRRIWALDIRAQL